MNHDSANKNQDLTVTFSVEQTPDEVFRAINDVRGWWSGQLAGPTDQLGGEFTYRYQAIHYSKHRVTELVPGKRVAWLTVDSSLPFVEHQSEWTGTTVTFDIERVGDKTEVRFTHVGLLPAHECYGACSRAWTSYITGSLRSRITTGKGQPNPKDAERSASGPAVARA